MIAKIKSAGQWLWRHFWALAFWKRAIIASTLGALGGSAVLAFFNRYALYYYAYSQEFRIPVEGVAYLDLAVSLLSFSFLAVSLLGAFGVYGLISFVSTALGKLLRVKTKGRIRTLKTVVAVVNVVVSIIASIITFLNFLTGVGELPGGDRLTGMGSHPVTLGILIIFVFASVLAAVVAFTGNRSIIKWFAIGFTVLGTFGLIVALFQPSFYGEFLRQIRFGGGIPVSVQFRSGEDSAEEIDGDLYIASNESIFIRTSDKNMTEIPKVRISKLTYTTARSPDPTTEQDGADQPATAPESKSEDNVKRKAESDGRPQ